MKIITCKSRIELSPTITDAKYVRLKKCYLFNAWNNISQSLGNHIIICTRDEIIEEHIIPDGNYNIDTLETEMKQSIPEMKLARHDPSGKVVIKKPRAITSINLGKLADILGFTNGILEGGIKFVADLPAKLTMGVLFYKIYCNIVDSTSTFCNEKRCELLALLPVRNFTKTQMVEYICSEPMVPVRSKIIHSIEFSITDQNDKPLPDEFNTKVYPIYFVIEIIS